MTASEPGHAPGRIVVIGGDLHGIFAAHLLGMHGAEVTLIESRSALGGPAANRGGAGLLPDPARPYVGGWMVHLLQGLADTGTLAALDWPAPFLCGGRIGNASPLRSGMLPSPWHLRRAVLRDPVLGGADSRAAMHRVLRALRTLGAGPRAALRDRTLFAWLHEIRAAEAGPALAAHLSSMGIAEPQGMAASRGAAMLQCAWMTSRWASRVAAGAPGGPDVAAECAEALQTAGVDVRTGTTARHISYDGLQMRAVVTDHGAVPCTRVIIAIDPVEAAGLCTAHTARRDGRFAMMTALHFERGAAYRVWITGDVAPGHYRCSGSAPLTHAVVHVPEEGGGETALDLYVRGDDEHDAIALATAFCADAPGVTIVGSDDKAVVRRRHAHCALPPGSALPGVGAHAGDAQGGLREILLAGSWCDVPSAGLAEGAFEAAFRAARRLMPSVPEPRAVPPGPLARRMRREDQWPPPAG